MSTVAQRAKEKGNAAFRAEKYPEAVGHYTEALLADGIDPTYPLNRAAAYLKLGKAFDAERDCSTALGLSPGHVKALYRRAQARMELGKLNEARLDLVEALGKEPANTAVRTELQKVDKLLSTRGKDKSVPIDVTKTVKRVSPQRRRVPIEIIEEDETNIGLGQSTNTLTPISCQLQHKPEDALPTPLPSPAREPAAPVPKSPEPLKPTPTTRGSIFRASGQHTIFQTPESSQPSPKPSTIPMKPASVEVDEPPRPSSLTLVEFSRAWELASPTERWDLLCKIPPQSLPTLFKTSLEAVLLIQIIEVCFLAVRSTDDSAIKARVREYLRWFQRVPRFSTVTLFLSKQERELATTLANAVGVSHWKT